MYGTLPSYFVAPTRPSLGANTLAKIDNRKYVSGVSFCLCVLLPCVIFAVVDAAKTYRSTFATIMICLSIAVVLGLGAPAYFSLDPSYIPGFLPRVLRPRADSGKKPTWYMFLFVVCFLAWAIAMFLGSCNYSLMESLREFSEMDVYVDVDPSKSKGQGLQDAGRILFTPGSHLDLTKSMSFKTSSTYCVAPVVANGTASGNSLLPDLYYDFWAVGVGCCGTEGTDFTCSDSDNPHASAGLRLMDDSARSYYRAAVQAAEARFSIFAPHPIFLIWMQDPVAYLTQSTVEASHHLLIQICIFCVCEFFAVALAATVYSKQYLNQGPIGF